MAPSANKRLISCIRHDSRSTLHALIGFTELLESEAYGPLTDDQRRCLEHMRVTVDRVGELLDGSAELCVDTSPFAREELIAAPVGPTMRGLVEGFSRDFPTANVDVEMNCPDDVAIMIEPATFANTIHMLMDGLLSSRDLQGTVRVFRAPGHARIVVTSEVQDASYTRPTSYDPNNLNLLYHLLTNRDFIRLKRCEASIARHGGTLAFNDDMSAASLLLPLD